MQKIIISLFQIWYRTVEIVFPAIAKKWAVNLFFTPLHYAVPQREKKFIERAKVSDIKFTVNPAELYNTAYPMGKVLNKNFNSNAGKEYYKFYELGEGPVVLLVHGWSGRASQMGALAEAFAESGYKVITFDAFAHGESPGKQTTVLEFIKIIKHLSESYGPFKAMIGHSLGGIACGKAILEGVKTEKLITIGSPTTFQYLLDAFGLIINARKKTTQYIKEFVEEYAKAPVEKYSLTNIATQLDIAGLIFHDLDDKEAIYDNAPRFDKSWKAGSLITTKGLGHSRILRDKEVIEQIVDYISQNNAVAV
jgi:pimeloyl-ACP methyl ester carboxylesterase